MLVQENIVIPRGALHEESLYGAVDRYGKNRKGETIVEKQSVLKYPLSSIVRKDIEFIVDEGIKKLVRQRFDNHTGNEKDVWKDLTNNPLLFNGAPIRSVRCFTGLKSEATATLDRGSVKPGNNHHIAIYVDRDGKRQESCVTFWHAVERKKHRIPVVITRPDEVWDHLPADLSEEFLAQLPLPDRTFEMSLQQNEMFVLGLEPDEFEAAMRGRDFTLLSKYLYRVQKIQKGEYYFRHHLQTKVDDISMSSKNAGFFQRYSMKSLFENSPQKVRISLLGEISKA